MCIRDSVVTDLNSYLTYISDIKETIKKEEGAEVSTKHFFFRGQASNEWNVMPVSYTHLVQNEHDHILWMVSNQSTKSVGFVTENIMFRKVRQDGFVKFIAIKL